MPFYLLMGTEKSEHVPEASEPQPGTLPVSAVRRVCWGSTPPRCLQGKSPPTPRSAQRPMEGKLRHRVPSALPGCLAEISREDRALGALEAATLDSGLGWVSLVPMTPGNDTRGHWGGPRRGLKRIFRLAVGGNFEASGQGRRGRKGKEEGPPLPDLPRPRRWVGRGEAA